MIVLPLPLPLPIYFNHCQNLLIFNDIFLFMKYYSMHNFTSQYVGRFNGDGEINKSKWLLVL
jgi:hypothetical protein